jgi:hypothetical protein
MVAVFSSGNSSFHPLPSYHSKIGAEHCYLNYSVIHCSSGPIPVSERTTCSSNISSYSYSAHDFEAISDKQDSAW